MFSYAQLSAAGLALLAISVSALPFDSDKSFNVNPKSLAATGWSGANGGVRIFYPEDNGIREICSDNKGYASEQQQWVQCSFMKDGSFNVPAEAQMAAVNTYGFGNDQTHVFFFTADNVLREWVYDGAWTVGQLSHHVPERSGKNIAAASWNFEGSNYRSVFYVEGGWVKEMTRKDGRGWEHAGTAGAIPDGQIAASVYVENGQVVKRVYSTSNVVKTFKQGSWVTEQDITHIQGRGLAGLLLPGQRQRFFTNDSNKKMIEYSYNNYVWDSRPNQIEDDEVLAGTPIAAALQSEGDKVWMYVVHIDDEGRLANILWNGSKWHSSEEVDIKVRKQ